MLQSNFEASYDPNAFEVVHIDTQNLSAAALHQHWDPYDPTFPVLVGCGSIYSQYGDGYIPFNVVIDTEGVLRYRASGFNQAALHNVIQQYLTLPTPFFQVQDLDILTDDNSDGRPDPGETVTFNLTLRNSPIAQSAWGISVAWSTTDGDVTETQASATCPPLSPGQVGTTAPVFSFTVAVDALPHWADFQFQIQSTYAGGSWNQTLSVPQRIARPDLLLVDSDGTLDDNESFAQIALNNMGVAYDMWTPEMDGSLSVPEALAYQRIIWLGGIRNPDINSTERASLEAFLDRGGLLLLSSQYASSDPLNTQFLLLRFGVQITATYGGNIFQAATPANDPWFPDLDFVLTGAVAANNCVHPDVISVVPPTVQMATWQQEAMGPAAAYLIDGGFNSVFCGFPIEALRLFGPLPGSVNLEGFLQRAFALHAANPPQPPDPVTNLILYPGPGLSTLMWTPVANADFYRVYESSHPWEFPPTPVLETTFPFVQLPAGNRMFYQVKSVR